MNHENEMILILPFPPSANHYKAQRVNMGRGPRIQWYLTAKAKAYIQEVMEIVARETQVVDKLCQQVIVVYMPDRRRRDVMNVEKVLNDSLVRAGIIKDDSLIYDHRIIKVLDDDGGTIVRKNGECIVQFKW